MTGRLAVVLFNLGGPDSPDAVRPFLFNLFNDKAIFRLPQPFRSALAAFVAKRRAPIATEIYRHIGGRSPILPNTEIQATALHAALGGGPNVRIFIAMRYWHPFTAQTVADVQAWNPDKVVLLPLYPQFSTTTTASSLEVWHKTARAMGFMAPSPAICCYPTDPGFIASLARLIGPALNQAEQYGRPRLLLSAHGLPEKVVKGGDPYQAQCEQTAQALAELLGRPDIEQVVCYQSRVGPLKWIGPSTDSEIHRAGRDKVPLVVVPIAFVSEHSETLVELDIEYRKLADESGVPCYVRVPTVDADPAFIGGLAALVRQAAGSNALISSGCGVKVCPPGASACALNALAR
jgi:ferrochelatase